MTTKRVRVGGSYALLPAVRVLMDTTGDEVDIERRSQSVGCVHNFGQSPALEIAWRFSTPSHTPATPSHTPAAICLTPSYFAALFQTT